MAEESRQAAGPGTPGATGRPGASGRPGALAVSLAATGLGFLIGIVVLVCTGRNPLVMLNALFQSVTGFNIGAGFTFSARLPGEFIVQFMPIALTGLAVAFAFRTGLFNIGAEGQVIAGSLGATFAASFIHMPQALPAWIALPLHAGIALLAGILAGAAWGAIPGFLKAVANVHEVVVCIMMNYCALWFSNLMLLHVVRTVDKVKTPAFARSSLLSSEFLSSITSGSRLNWGFVLVAIAFLVWYLVIERMSAGFALRAVGLNREAARAVGIPVRREMVMSMAASGGFAGLAGAIICLGTFGLGRVIPGFENYGFDGIAVALVGANTAPGVFFSALLFAMLKAAGPLMQSAAIPKEIGLIISSSIVFFVALKLAIEYLITRRGGKRA